MVENSSIEPESIQTLWTRWEAWLAVNAPSLLDTLQGGASEQQIKDAEAALGVEFPEDFRVSYRIHNGQVAYEDGLIDGRELLSLERIQDEWQVWKGLLDSGELDEFRSEPIGPIQGRWWSDKWIPLTYDGSGNHDCLDLIPAEGGSIGQVIDFWHDAPERKVTAGSFSQWLADYVEGCETGKYIYSEEDDALYAQDTDED